MHLLDLFESTNEGYTVTRGIDRERYQERAGLEGPFQTKSGKVVYYDKKEGKYYDPDTDMYIDHDDYAALDEGVGTYLKGAVLAGLLGMGVNQMASMTDAKNSPLGQAMAQAAEQGDQYAAKHLEKLDSYFDLNDTGSIKILSQKYLNKTIESVYEEVATNKRTERILKLLRAKNPSAENDLEALILSFDKGQKMDREDINTLYSQNREEDREIADLERELEALKKRRGMNEEESRKEKAEKAMIDAVKKSLAKSKADAEAKAKAQPKATPKPAAKDPHADKSLFWRRGYQAGYTGREGQGDAEAMGPDPQYQAGYKAGMKARELTNEDYYETDEQRELARLGRILMDMGAKRDDAVGAAMGAVGNELTKYGSPEGVSSIEKLQKVTGQPESVIMKMMALAQKVQGDVAVGADVEDEEELEEADFDTNFKKRIGYTVKGGAAADMMKKQAAQAQADNPDAGKGLGPGVLDIAKARKKAKEKGVKAPGNLRASPNTRDPKRLPEEELNELSPELHKRYQDAAFSDAAKGMAKKRMGTMSSQDAYDNEKKRYAGIDQSKYLNRLQHGVKEAEEGDIKIGDTVETKKMGQMQGVVTGFSTKTGDTRVMFKHKSGKVYATVPENLKVISAKKTESLDDTVVEASRPTKMRFPGERFSKELNTQDFELSSMYDHRSIDQLYQSLNVANNAIQKVTLKIEKLQDAGKRPVKTQQALEVLKRKRDYISDLIDQKEMQGEVVELDEAKKKPVPTKPDKWAYAKAQAKKKFDVYPSAYANAWAAKKYKELGGGWRMGKKK